MGTCQGEACPFHVITCHTNTNIPVGLWTWEGVKEEVRNHGSTQEFQRENLSLIPCHCDIRRSKLLKTKPGITSSFLKLFLMLSTLGKKNKDLKPNSSLSLLSDPGNNDNPIRTRPVEGLVEGITEKFKICIGMDREVKLSDFLTWQCTNLWKSTLVCFRNVF